MAGPSGGATREQPMCTSHNLSSLSATIQIVSKSTQQNIDPPCLHAVPFPPLWTLLLGKQEHLVLFHIRAHTPCHLAQWKKCRSWSFCWHRILGIASRTSALKKQTQGHVFVPRSRPHLPRHEVHILPWRWYSKPPCRKSRTSMTIMHPTLWMQAPPFGVSRAS